MGATSGREDANELATVFDAINAAGISPAELTGDISGDAPLEGRRGAGAPPLVGYGVASTLRFGAGEDAIPTSVTMPAGAEPAMPAPEPSPAPQLAGVRAWIDRIAPHRQRLRSDERERLTTMDKWEDSAMSAMTGDATTAGANGVMPGAQSGVATSAGGAASRAAGSANTSERGSEWAVEIDETRALSRATQAALVVGAASVTALAIAGGVTWFIIQRRRMSAAREIAEAVAASRLLRLTPAVARPDVLEATKAVGSATQHAQMTAAETARMARALRHAAELSAASARDFAAERAAVAQETLSEALDTARGGATDAWRTVAQAAPFQNPSLLRAFNAGRLVERMRSRIAR